MTHPNFCLHCLLCPTLAKQTFGAWIQCKTNMQEVANFWLGRVWDSKKNSSLIMFQSREQINPSCSLLKYITEHPPVLELSVFQPFQSFSGDRKKNTIFHSYLRWRFPAISPLNTWMLSIPPIAPNMRRWACGKIRSNDDPQTETAQETLIDCWSGSGLQQRSTSETNT